MNKKEREIIKKHYKNIGKIGGGKTLVLYGKKHYSKAGKLGALKRWQKVVHRGLDDNN